MWNIDLAEESSKLELYYAERKLASPIIHLIHDWQQAKQKGQEKPELELKQEILNLLDNGADVNEPELPRGNVRNYGNTPILMASKAGAVEVVQALIERGANLEALPCQGYIFTSLGTAIVQNNSELVKLLIENGANIGILKNISPDTALHIACRYDRLEMAEILIENGADYNEPAWADDYYGSALTPLQSTIIRAASPKLAKLLIEKGADLEKQSSRGYTALHMAVFRDQFEIAEIIIKNGADVNFINFNADGQNPLHLAATKNYPKIIKMLIDYGAEIHARNIQGDDALQLSLHLQRHENFKSIIFNCL